MEHSQKEKITTYGWSMHSTILLMVFAFMWGCTTLSPPPQDTQALKENEKLANVQIQDLAGKWEIELSSAVYPLTFDEQGNGTYEWKHGRFLTTSLENGLWRGTWHQRDNDREGGFEIELSEDLRVGEGNWWYTRIGQDHEPLNPGGTFRLTRPRMEVREN